MRNLIVEYTRIGTRVEVHVIVDNVAYDDDSNNFCDVAYAEGMMTDEFHHATQNRYKDPSPAIKPFSRKLLEKK